MKRQMVTTMHNNNNYQYLTTLPRQSKFLSVFFVHTCVHVMCSALSNVLVGIILQLFFRGYACNVAQNYSVEFKGKKTYPCMKIRISMD